jgi:hypothetical protein
MAQQVFRIGAFATDTVTDIINLQGFTTTTGNLCTLRKSGVTSGYQVTAGKTFYAAKIIIMQSDNTAIVNGVSFGYADNDIGQDTTTARTNPVAMIGNPEGGSTIAAWGIVGNPSYPNSPWQSPASLNNVNGTIYKLSIAAKYMYFKAFTNTGLMSVLVTGFEI